jgi:hypothetical protein
MLFGMFDFHRVRRRLRRRSWRALTSLTSTAASWRSAPIAACSSAISRRMA